MEELNPLWASVSITIVLVCITAYYALETRKIRIESIKPSFSITMGPYPGLGLFTSEDEISGYGLYLINNGGRAKDIRIDVQIDTPKSKNTIDKFYSPSLSSGEWLSLETIPDHVKSVNGRIEIFLSYKDEYHKNLTDKFSYDYSEMEKEGREINTYSDNQIGLLVEIKTCLKKIASSHNKQIDEFSNISNEIEKLTKSIRDLKKIK